MPGSVGRGGGQDVMEGHAPCSGGVEHRLSGLGASWPAPVGGEPPGFGEGGDGHVRFALIENELRTHQAIRNLKKALPKLG